MCDWSEGTFYVEKLESLDMGDKELNKHAAISRITSLRYSLDLI